MVTSFAGLAVATGKQFMRKRTTETALPARGSRWDCERCVDVATTTLRGDNRHGSPIIPSSFPRLAQGERNNRL